MSNEWMQNQKQHLSELVDGELSEADARRLLDRLGKEPLLKQQWTDMYTTRALLRRAETPVLARPAFADRVSAAIASEPAILAPRALPKKTSAFPFWNKAGAAAVAASVAALSLFLLPAQHGPISVSSVSTVSTSAQGAKPAPAVAGQPKGSQWSPVNLPTDSLDQYLAKHRAMEANMEWLKATTAPKAYN